MSDVAQVAVLNAGIGERGNFFDPANDGWIKTLDVDLTAVLHGVRWVARYRNWISRSCCGWRQGKLLDASTSLPEPLMTSTSES